MGLQSRFLEKLNQSYVVHVTLTRFRGISEREN